VEESERRGLPSQRDEARWVGARAWKVDGSKGADDGNVVTGSAAKKSGEPVRPLSHRRARRHPRGTARAPLALLPAGLGPTQGYGGRVASPIRLVEFPADEPARARRFWTGLLGVDLEERPEGEGEGWQTGGDAPALGLHPRGTGPGDRVSLPYFSVSDMEAALNRVRELGGEVIHPGEKWSVCRDSEGSPFGLALDASR
jgi:predicted enzyme related to lactoylglutathione lyase